MNNPAEQEFYGWLKTRIGELKVKNLEEGKWSN